MASLEICTPNSISRASISSRWCSESQPDTVSLLASSGSSAAGTPNTSAAMSRMRFCTGPHLDGHLLGQRQATVAEVQVVRRLAGGREAAAGVEVLRQAVALGRDADADDPRRATLGGAAGQEGQQRVLDAPA